jgi:predicted metal-dependent phosphoesterase TrpH
VIDLHLHTTASDGRSTPGELVDYAAQAGLTVMSVTDHDTTAAVAAVTALAAERGIEAISGIEITAVLRSRDVHMLGYFYDASDAAFRSFLLAQREARVARAEAIVGRLADLQMPIDFTEQIAAARSGVGPSLARPHVARAMVAAGHVKDLKEAFDKWLAEGQPAFMERIGPPPSAVIEAIHAAGGLASLAHPGRTRIDADIPDMVAAGLDAIEVYHSDHDDEKRLRYAAIAAEHRLLVTGGTDFHADPASPLRVGTVTLPPAEWEWLSASRDRHRMS